MITYLIFGKYKRGHAYPGLCRELTRRSRYKRSCTRARGSCGIDGNLGNIIRVRRVRRVETDRLPAFPDVGGPAGLMGKSGEYFSVNCVKRVKTERSLTAYLLFGALAVHAVPIHTLSVYEHAAEEDMSGFKGEDNIELTTFFTPLLTSPIPPPQTAPQTTCTGR